MYYLTFILFLTLLTYCILNFKKITTLKNHYLIIIFSGLLIRFLLLNINFTFESDINTFKFWSYQLYSLGISNFYTGDFFKDYLPGYMYILYFIGFLVDYFNIPYESDTFTMLLKMPPIIFDILTSILIYKISLYKVSTNKALLFSSIYSFNPVILLNSAIWGQVDSFHTLVLVFAIYMLTNKKYLFAYIAYTFSITIKPQSLIVAPIFIFSFYEYLKLFNFSKRAFFNLFTYGIACILTFIFLIIPFSLNYGNLNFFTVINQYISTISSYPYITINAYNFYAFLGLNWHNVNDTILFSTYARIGIYFIIMISIFTLYILYKNKFSDIYFFAAALINTLTFMLSIKMHERYLFPSLVFLLIAFIYTNNKKLLILYLGYSITLFINCFDVLYQYNYFNNTFLKGPSLELVSLTNVALTIILVFISLNLSKKKLNKKNSYTLNFLIYKPLKPESTKKFSKLTKLDYMYMIIIVLIYSIISFINLGVTKSPQNTWFGKINESVILEFDEVEYVSDMSFLLGARNNQKFILEYSIDGKTFIEFLNSPIEGISVFAWSKTPLNIEAKYIRITPITKDLWLQEIAFFNYDNLLKIKTTSDISLIDEQDLVPIRPNYKNSTYFDEIYHARTGYEFANNLDIYETTHPPLGKVIISLGVKIFGMTPFGFRIMGNLIGILMIPIMYIFSKKMFNSSYFALFSTLLLTFDFMHFAQTRIATIDSYVTFFIMLMYYFMFLYYKTSFYDTKLYKTLIYLLFSGIFMGLAISSKWQGIYATLGLATIFFITIIKRYREFLYAKENNILNIKNIFIKNTTVTFVWCILSFIIIPLIIYSLSYIPYLKTPSMNSFKDIIDNQKWMLNYHSYVEASHPFSSSWWKWPFNIRPIFYFSDTIAFNNSSTIKSGISSFGNPLVWWVGVFSFFYSFHVLSKRNSRTIIFLLIAIASQILPWVFITRVTFIYHYFPTVPFLILLITYFFKDYFKENKKPTNVYLTFVIIVFIMFYPILSGMPVSESYVKRFLEWLPSWNLI